MASRQKTSSLWIYYSVGGALLLWLLLSLAFDKSPRYIVNDLFQIAMGQKDKISKNDKQWEKYLAAKSQEIDSLKVLINAANKLQTGKSGTVSTDGNGLNMRKLPDINADIVIKIPDGAIVVVVFIDPEERKLDGTNGNWVKATYKNTSGWIWSKYIRF